MVDGTPVPALSGVVRIAGFRPSTPYLVQWWDTYQPDAARQVLRAETLTTTADGVLAISIVELTSDVALQVTPTATAAAEPPRVIRSPFPWRGFYAR